MTFSSYYIPYCNVHLLPTRLWPWASRFPTFLPVMIYLWTPPLSYLNLLHCCQLTPAVVYPLSETLNEICNLLTSTLPSKSHSYCPSEGVICYFVPSNEMHHEACWMQAFCLFAWAIVHSSLRKPALYWWFIKLSPHIYFQFPSLRHKSSFVNLIGSH